MNPEVQLEPLSEIVARAEAAFERRDFDETERLLEQANVGIESMLAGIQTARAFIRTNKLLGGG